MNDVQQATSEDSASVTPPRRARWWRPLVLLLVFVGLLVWLVRASNHAEQQLQLTRQIESLGGHVIYSYRGVRATEPKGPAWVRSLLGEQYFVTLASIHVPGLPAADAELRRLTKGIDRSGVEAVYLDQTQIDDRAVGPLKDLKDVKVLSISGHKLSPAASSELKKALSATDVRLAP